MFTGIGWEDHHILTSGNGLPLAITLSAANVNDHLVLPELLDKVGPLRGRPGRPRRRITTLIAAHSATPSRRMANARSGSSIARCAG